MFRKNIAIVSLLTVCHQLHGWGQVDNALAQPVLESPVGFPYNDAQAWYVKETYLIMRPYEDDLDYANHINVKETSTDLSVRFSPEKPDFDWFSGFRLAAGRYLPNHDAWDIDLCMTYFYAEENGKSTPNRAKGTTLTPIWIPHFTGNTTDGEVVWRLNYFTWDLSFGRNFSVLKSLIAHPYIGLRGALIYKGLHVKYKDHFNNGTTVRDISDKFKGSSDYWGIGPRLGVDFTFNFKGGWSFLGNFAGAIFFGSSDVDEKIGSTTTQDGVTSVKTFKASDDRFAIRGNLEGAFGIGWETWVRSNSVRIAPSLMLEGITWFDTNQLFEVQEGLIPIGNHPLLPDFNSLRRQGDLTLMGFSINLQVDF